MYYFSYGSNMSIRRLLHRVPSARKVDIGILEMHELKFHKVGKIDGSAKCDVYETGDPEHYVYGVLFLLSPKDMAELDRIEGLGYGYEQKDIQVVLHNGSNIKASTYYATSIEPTLKPFSWYKEHVLRGANENSLPKEYIQVIERIEAVEDADVKRHKIELAIYR